MDDAVSEYLAEKLGEYRILSAPLQRAADEMDYTNRLLRARFEHEISEHIPALGAIAEILDISILDLLMAKDRQTFIQDAMSQAGVSTDDIKQQLKSLTHPTSDELNAIGLEG
jgi:AAA+ superfamily predicted ATPase